MKRLILILICLGMWGLNSAQASTIYVHGDVWGTWSADTVVVEDSVRVPPDSTLIIEPGVEVLFWVHCKFIVDSTATLTAVGTSADSIRFDEYFQGNRWHGIRFLTASVSSSLEYCHLTHGWATGSGGDADGGGIYCYNSDISIQNCLIDSCSADDQGGGIYSIGSSPTISHNTLRYNSSTYYGGGGIYCFGSSPSISENTISGNSSAGIYCDQSNANISDNTITDNGWGIYCYQCEPDISGNTISGNSIYGIRCENQSSPTISDNDISNNSNTGIFCSQSSPTISNNTIEYNSGSYGGGINCSSSSNPTISNNTIAYNPSFYGGGIYCSSSSPAISNNTIQSNSGTYGGGIYCSSSSPTISNNILTDNSGSSQGGGIYCYSSNPPTSNNIISTNVADDGGGIYCNGFNDTMKFNIITDNTAGVNGGGISLTDSDPDIINNTISRNSATSYGGGIYCNSSDPNITNCILYSDQSANGPEIWPASGSSPNVTYSDVQGYWPGTGNIDLDPLFRDPGNSDFHLQSMTNPNCGDPADSPCLDAGDPSILDSFLDCAWGLGTDRSDMGAYGGGAKPVAVTEESTPMPREFLLFQNYPNPFNATTVINYQLPVSDYVKLEIFNLVGQNVATLIDCKQQTGYRSVVWDASEVSSGLYFYKLTAGDFAETRRMMLVK